MEKMQKDGAKFETEGAGRLAREERIRAEQRLLKEQKKKEEQDEKKELKKQEDARMRTKLDLAENARQIAAKKLKEEQEREREQNYLARFNNEAATYKKEVKDSYWVEKEKKKAYKSLLAKQLNDDKKFDKNLVGCSDTVSHTHYTV
jgi:hypothetical protein